MAFRMLANQITPLLHKIINKVCLQDGGLKRKASAYTITMASPPLSPGTTESIAAEMTIQYNQCHEDARQGVTAGARFEPQEDEYASFHDGSDDISRGSSFDSSDSSSYASEESYESSNSAQSDSFSDWSSIDGGSRSSLSSDDKQIMPQCQNNADQNVHPNLLHRKRPQCSSSLTSSLFTGKSHEHQLDERRRNNSGHNSKYTKQSKHHARASKSSTTLKQRIIRHFSTMAKSTKLLSVSFVFWSFVQFYIVFLHHGSFYDLFYRDKQHWGMSGRQRKAWMRDRQRFNNGQYRNRGDNIIDEQYTSSRKANQHYHDDNAKERLRNEAKAALGTAAASSDDHYVRHPGKPNTSRRRRSKKSDEQGNTRTERLREGCTELEWHSYVFPTCNEIHAIDLRDVVRKRRHGVDLRYHDNTLEDGRMPWGFVGNGLWRDVFSCDPHSEIYTEAAPPAVLKMMKSEHPYDQRNYQRHRRDALVMELLSSSHHLVSIYGYCSNTVLTQAISHTLEDVIYAREYEHVKTWSPVGGYKTKPKIEDWMGRNEYGDLLVSRETEVGRIQLALGVFRGLMDLHEGVGYRNRKGEVVEWLPIIHADLQAKQYLVDSTTGQIYLNDFNRCRFVTKKSDRANNTYGRPDTATSLESCPVYIPTSPGASRSPEEYDSAPLSEKLDVYSAGNILYGIITGERPWNNERGKHVKASIQRGDRPEVNETFRNNARSVDAALTRLLDRTYEGDPVKRASAKEIVLELEKLLEEHTHNK